VIEQLQMVLGRIFKILGRSLNQPLFEDFNQLVFVDTICKRGT
jgi:hypothetical protein